MLCPRCGGSGKTHESTPYAIDDCSVCEGLGQVAAPTPPVDRPTPRIVDAPCPQCNAEGSWVYRSPHTNTEMVIPCDLCGSKGSVPPAVAAEFKQRK